MARQARTAAGAEPAERAVRRRRASPAAAVGLMEVLRTQVPQVHQERARRSYETLLDSAEKLFARDGYDAVGTPEIAAAAGVAVGTFYRYFDDKKQIFLEIVRRYLRSAFHETLDRLTPERFVGLARHETIDETVAILFAYVNARPGLNRVLVEMSLRDAEVARLRAEVETAACQRLAALVAAVCPPSVVPDAEAMAWVLHAAALECATSATPERTRGAGGALPGRAPMSAARARAALTRLIERTLFGGG